MTPTTHANPSLAFAFGLDRGPSLSAVEPGGGTGAAVLGELGGLGLGLGSKKPETKPGRCFLGGWFPVSEDGGFRFS